MRAAIIILIGIIASSESLANKKDFRGLFGSYRKEKFIENNANPTDFGLDFSLSTLLPISTLATSKEVVNGNQPQSLYYASFFDYEGSLFFTLNYHWQFSLNSGYFGYDTRRENADPAAVESDPTKKQDQPLFHEFEMNMVPLLAGVRYRFTTNDIVPFVGISAGAASVTRRVSYDYDPTNTYAGTVTSIAFAAQLNFGFEFYMTSNVGLRLEASGMYVGVSAFERDPGSPASYPVVTAAANPVMFRYASGIFFLF